MISAISDKKMIWNFMITKNSKFELSFVTKLSVWWFKNRVNKKIAMRYGTTDMCLLIKIHMYKQCVDNIL